MCMINSNIYKHMILHFKEGKKKKCFLTFNSISTLYYTACEECHFTAEINVMLIVNILSFCIIYIFFN